MAELVLGATPQAAYLPFLTIAAADLLTIKIAWDW